jgi:hypothetical protein
METNKSQWSSEIPDSMKFLNGVKLLVATPVHDHRVHGDFMISMIALLQQSPFPIGWVKMGGAGIARARNSMANTFLDGDFTHLMFIDSDIAFHPHDVWRLIEHNVPIIGGMYFTKGTKNMISAELKPGAVAKDGKIEVNCVGTGFLLLQKHGVLEAMIDGGLAKKFIEDLDEDHGKEKWGFFMEGVVDGRWLSEDWYLHVMARKLGFQIWMDTVNAVWHYGTLRLPIMELIEKDRPESGVPVKQDPNFQLCKNIS